MVSNIVSMSLSHKGNCTKYKLCSDIEKTLVLSITTVIHHFEVFVSHARVRLKEHVYY